MGIANLIAKLDSMVETNDKHGDDYVGHHEDIREIREELLTMIAPALPSRCTEIADQVVPGCRTHIDFATVTYTKRQHLQWCDDRIAVMWTAAWDAACIALGGDPAEFR